ncbi:ATP-grasp domain-containing protein [Streptomyces sparsus]
MPSAHRPRILYVTDLTYPARGRRYCDEDIHLSARLRDTFDLALCHPLDAAALMDAFDAVVVRNSGPVMNYRAAFDTFRGRATSGGVRVWNELTGRADMLGKQYLVDLYAAGYPVIPTVDRARDLDRLPEADEYVTKPKHGADSIGMRLLPPDRLRELARDLELTAGRMLVQPRIPFRYEVSFFFVDRTFHYALHAPRPEERWQLEPYEPTAADLDFAQRFVDWNEIDHGIQRVDACRTPEGDLLLVELEDLNPYLSLDALPQATQDGFVSAVRASLHDLLAGPPAAPPGPRR